MENKIISEKLFWVQTINVLNIQKKEIMCFESDLNKNQVLKAEVKCRNQDFSKEPKSDGKAGWML